MGIHNTNKEVKLLKMLLGVFRGGMRKIKNKTPFKNRIQNV